MIFHSNNVTIGQIKNFKNYILSLPKDEIITFCLYMLDTESFNNKLLVKELFSHEIFYDIFKEIQKNSEQYPDTDYDIKNNWEKICNDFFSRRNKIERLKTIIENNKNKSLKNN